MKPIAWQDAWVSSCETFHCLEGKPLYSQRYDRVMKYHTPGLAPVKDQSLAFHIDSQGLPAYSNRFLEVFGFYQGLAAVRNEQGWFHINPQGEPVYSARYDWCGNFQEGLCPVNSDSLYFHINGQGEKIYPASYRYVGDFKEGLAVVCNELGLHSHIMPQGKLSHGQWFLDLDVFHKGFARAKDEKGWFHIDKSGRPIYQARYAAVEPFYNGLARVERPDGGLITLNPQGEIISELRPALQKPWEQLSADMVGFWRTETIATAVRLKVFDFLPATTSTIALTLKLSTQRLERLLRGLWELNLITLNNDVWALTEKGGLLAPQAQSFLAAAAIMWSDVNTENWKCLSQSLSSDAEEQRPLFKALASDTKLRLYHQAIDGYAVQDFSFLNLPIDWSMHQKIIGVGRTAKTLVEQLLQNNPHQTAVLLGEDYILKYAEVSPTVAPRYHLKSQNILEPWTENADAILLPKVLHYWSDQKVLKILKNACRALSHKGIIYIFEMLLSKDHPNGSLLDLNMWVETGGQLRFLSDWQWLLAESQLKLQQHFVIKPWLNVLVVRPLSIENE